MEKTNTLPVQWYTGYDCLDDSRGKNQFMEYLKERQIAPHDVRYAVHGDKDLEDVAVLLSAQFLQISEQLDKAIADAVQLKLALEGIASNMKHAVRSKRAGRAYLMEKAAKEAEEALSAARAQVEEVK